MYLGEILGALLIALVISALFVHGFKRRGPWNSFTLFFLIIFLAVLVALKWVPPRGPALFGVYWIPLLVTGLIFALVLAAAALATDKKEKEREKLSPGSEADVPAARTLDVFFWTLLFMLIVLVVTGYIWPRPAY